MWLTIRNFILPVFSTLVPNWGYDGITGPGSWSNNFPACGGKNQSPINIITATTAGNYIWSPLGFKNYNVIPLHMTLFNNGRTVHMMADFPKAATVQGEPLGGKYVFSHINFHWGTNSTSGSEHMIDGGSYPLEFHMVHYKKEYIGLEDAMKHRDGVVVLAVFAEVRYDNNYKLDSFIEGLTHIVKPDSKFDLMPFNLENFLPPNTTYFYKYQGSLSTPPCEEEVTWIIFKNSLKISVDQVQKFRELTKNGGGPMVDNFRPIQPLHGRTVHTGMEIPHWSYGDDDPGRWDRYYKLCAGSSQSPIDIRTNSTLNTTSWENFHFENYNITPHKMSITNNGHTAMVSISTTLLPTIQGGNLGSGYTFMQFHLHWGENDATGSEHTVDGQRFPSELHIVNFKAEYVTPKEAVKYNDGIAVLGVFLEYDEEDNAKLNSIISGLESIKFAGSNTSIPPFPLQDLLPENLREFYRYKGSLTTPTCNEVVTWTVFRQPITISKTQVSKFRELEDPSGHGIVNTFRPVKPINGRVVHYAKLN